MHYNARHDSSLALKYSPIQADVVYRSEGPPLAYLLNCQILRRTREVRDGKKALSLVNSLAPVTLRPLVNQRLTKGLVAAYGHNRNQLEVIGVGGQHLRCQQRKPECSVGKTPLEQCFEDVLESECLNCAFVQQHRTTRSATFTVKEESISCSEAASGGRVVGGNVDTSDAPNGKRVNFHRDLASSYSNKLFRFKRLAAIYPCNFSADPITEVLVDDKLPDSPFVYAYNDHGVVIAQLQVNRPENEGKRLPCGNASGHL